MDALMNEKPHRNLPTDEYRISDLGIGSLLLARDVPLLRVEHRTERAEFIFPASAEAVASRFYFPGDNVNARRFHQALRELRGLARRKEPH